MASLFQTLRRRKSRTTDPFGDIEREDTDIDEMEAAKEQLREGDTYSIVLPRLLIQLLPNYFTNLSILVPCEIDVFVN